MFGILVVDIQGDFTTWKKGSLAVPNTDENYVKEIERTILRFQKENKGFLIASQDWHPSDYISFASNHLGKKLYDRIEINGKTQILWPDHCIQETEGSKLLIDENIFNNIIKKGQDPNSPESYSAVKDSNGVETGLVDILHTNNINQIAICGVATEYCVKETAIDLIKSGFQVFILKDLCRGISPYICYLAFDEMKQKGIEIWTRKN